MFIPGVVMCTIVSVYLIFFGFFIGKKKELGLLTFFDENAFKGDKDKLSNAIGMLVVGVGIVIFILPFALNFIGIYAGVIIGMLVIAAGLASVIFYIYLNKTA
jgi:hypothetical protein